MDVGPATGQQQKAKLQDTGTGKDFVNRSPVAWDIIGGMDKWDEV